MTFMSDRLKPPLEFSIAASLIHILLQRQANPPEFERLRKHLTVKHIIAENCRHLQRHCNNLTLTNTLVGNSCSVSKTVVFYKTNV